MIADAVFSLGLGYEMEPSERLHRARVAAGLNTRELAERVGTSRQQIEKLEKADRALTKEWAERIAPHIGVTPVFLLFGGIHKVDNVNDGRWATVPLAPLKIVGIVEAGAWRDITTAEYPEEEVMLPRDEHFPRARQYCLVARGDSMNAARPIPILEGAILRCVDFGDSGLELKTGQIAIVQRTRDGGHLVETTVKRVAILPDRIELRPESDNPNHRPLIWSEETERTGETRVIGIVTAITNTIAA